MLRRPFSVLGVLVLVAVALPSGAHAEVADAGMCRQLLRTSSVKSVGETTPHVVTRDVEGGDFSVLWIDAVNGGTTNTLTSCTFHDRNRNGVYDWQRERAFAVQEVFTVDAENSYGKWPYGVVLTGIVHGEQACSRRALSSRSSDGALSRSTTRTSCYPVDFSFVGD